MQLQTCIIETITPVFISFWRNGYNHDVCACPSKSNDINSMEEQVIWFVQFSEQQGVRSGGEIMKKEKWILTKEIHLLSKHIALQQ